MESTTTDALVEEHYEQVHCYVRMRVPAGDCDDVVSEVFLRAVERGRERRSGDAGPWLFSIARSRVADYYRRRGGRVVTVPYPAGEEAGVSGNGPSRQSKPGSSVTPLEELERAEFMELLHRKMQELTEPERDVIAFKFTDGLANSDIAALVGVTPGHLGVLLHRALGKLRGLMLKEAADVVH
ncbi:MAG: RNA polymerase sigma factor [Planctomycetota bacterium]